MTISKCISIFCLVLMSCAVNLGCSESANDLANVRSVPTSGGGQQPGVVPTMVSIEAGTGAFIPASVTITAGLTVTWTNTDTVEHQVVSDVAGLWDSGVLAAGGSFTHTFDTAGTFNYHCSLHPEMTGTVVVTEAPVEG